MIIVGDVIHSVGTRSYLREMLVHMEHLEPQLHMFQFRLDDRSTQSGWVKVDDFKWPLRMSASRTLFRFLPRPFYRLYERGVLLLFLLQSLSRISRDDVLIASGCLGGLHLLRWKLPHEKWWLKLGVIEEEGVGTLRYRFRKWLEAKHAALFENRIFVSKPMGEFLDREYGNAKGRQITLPCLVDLERFPQPESREALRQQLGMDGHFVVCYVGTAAHWQCSAETVEIFRNIQAKRPESFFWVFTPDKQRFEELLAGLPPECWSVEFRPHDELAGLLPAADVACLIRRRELLNRVSSPLKFPEYMACGLPVLIGPEVGQYSEMVSQQGLGVIVDPGHPERWDDAIGKMFELLDSRDDIRMKCLKVASSLSWQGYASVLEQLLPENDGRDNAE